jgi:hypothetical protein
MRPFFDLCLTFLVQKPLLRAYISMLLDCSYFPFLFALGLENYGGLDPKSVQKVGFFTLKPRQKDLWRFGDFDGRRKTAFRGEIGRIFAVARLVYALQGS